jgi:hypothetical protein
MKYLYLVLLTILFTVTICEGVRNRRLHRDPAGLIKLGREPIKADYSTRWFTQTIDHFNWFTQPQTYQQRYLYNGVHH